MVLVCYAMVEKSLKLQHFIQTVDSHQFFKLYNRNCITIKLDLGSESFNLLKCDLFSMHPYDELITSFIKLCLLGETPTLLYDLTTWQLSRQLTKHIHESLACAQSAYKLLAHAQSAYQL